MVALDKEHQVFVSYIGGLTEKPPDDVLLVKSDEDYVRACFELSNSLKSGDIHKVWVRSKNHYAWLRDFAEQIGCRSTFEEKTARLLLAEKWNVNLPQWLTDADVLENDLLKIDVDSKKQTNFESRFLSHLLGAIFQSNDLTIENLADVINVLVRDDARAALNRYPLLQSCLENKCVQWTDRSSETWVRDICKWLPEDSTKVWQWLCFWSVLHHYPKKLLEYVLAPEQVFIVRGIPPEAVSDLPLESAAREQILTQIDDFFKGIQKQVNTSDEFKKVVEWTSGRLFREYFYISSILTSKQFSPTVADIRMVREKFKSCSGVSESQLNSLDYCVKPGRPTLIGPDEEWASTDWIRWTIEEYMPYRNWQVHNGHYDEDLEQTVARFSDWYIREYASVHKDPDLSLTHCLNDLLSSDLKDEFVILLLVDCLPLGFMDLLDEALRNAGFNRHNLNCRFSGLPTITENNKTALLSGEWQDKAGNYEVILKTRSDSDWDGKKVIYLNNLRSFAEMEVPQESTIVVLNFLDGDELLHSDIESKNTTYEDELHRLFMRMVDAVNRLSQEWAGSRKNFSVYVVTDHGACRILEEEKSSFDSAVINKLFSNEKHRFSFVPESQVDEIPENLWALGHRFKQPFTKENTIYFLPRGHNTVRQAGKSKGYMHGGVSPEEVIVPSALYKLVKAAWKMPAARILNLDFVKETRRAKFYIQRVVTLEVELKNPNKTDIRIIRATITSPETDLKNCELIDVPAESENTLQISCYFKNDALGEKNLEIEIAYEIAGEQHTLPLTLKSEFKSAMVSGFSLKDL
jgi:hypothetical protein